MKLNINFLQTGGVPLTADLMDNIEEQIKFFDFLGDLAGNLTILTGCVVTGSNVSSGIVAINGECYFFEGGLATSTVFINTQQITKTFQDQTDKILIERKTVKFGTSTPSNTFTWANFTRLYTLKEMQIKIGKAATQISLDDLAKRVEKVELKTAPIENGFIALPFFRPISEIPAGWKECIDLRGRTIVGLDPNDVDLKTLRGSYGEKTHQLSESELPNIKGEIQTITGNSYNGNVIFKVLSGFAAWILGSNNGQYSHKTLELNFGGNKSHNNMQPSLIANYIEPDFQ